MAAENLSETWLPLLACHPSQLGQVVKQLFANQKGGGAAKAIGMAQFVVDTVASFQAERRDLEKNKRLAILRGIFQYAPKFVHPHLQLKEETLETMLWVCQVASSPSLQDVPAPVRGVALSVLGHVLRHMCPREGQGKEQQLLDAIAFSIATNLRIVNESFAVDDGLIAVEEEQGKEGSGKEGTGDKVKENAAAADAAAADTAVTATEAASTAAASSMAASIILHQCVEVLEAAADPNPGWLKQVGYGSIGVVSSILLKLNAKKGSNSSALAHTLVDAAKAFTMVAEIFVLHKTKERQAVNNGEERVEGETKKNGQDEEEAAGAPSSEAEQSWINAAPSALIAFVLEGTVLHDAFHSAFNNAVQALRCCSDPSNAAATQAIVNSIRTTCVEHVARGAVASPLDLRRTEAIIGFLGCLQVPKVSRAAAVAAVTAVTGGAGGAGGGGHQDVVGEEDDDEVPLHVVSEALLAIASLQQRMKQALVELTQQQQQTSSIFSSLVKEMRQCCSECRKGSIATVDSIIAANPRWVTQNTKAYWDLCLKALSTPVLFATGFKAFVSVSPRPLPLAQLSLDEQQQQEGESETEAFIAPMLLHIKSALQNVGKYPPSVAMDLLASLSDLCEADCYSLLSSRYDILSCALKAYTSRPKLASGQNQDAVTEWKREVAHALKALCHLQERHLQTSLSGDVEDTKTFRRFASSFLAVATLNFTSLHRSVGTTPGPKGLASAGAPHKEAMKMAKAEFGTSEAEPLMNLLHALTEALLALLGIEHLFALRNGGEVAGGGGGGEEDAGDDGPSNLSALLAFINGIADRNVVFEDDGVQLCCEMDLLVKGCLQLFHISSTNANKLLLITTAIETICVAAAVDSKEKQNASMFGRTAYETGREAILVLADRLPHALTAAFIQQIHRTLPLALNDKEQPLLPPPPPPTSLAATASASEEPVSKVVSGIFRQALEAAYA